MGNVCSLLNFTILKTLIFFFRKKETKKARASAPHPQK